MMAMRTLTAFFERRENAEAARGKLREAGVLDADLGVSPEVSDRAAEPKPVFWAALNENFGAAPEYSAYREAVRRGAVMIIAQVDEARVEKACGILDAHGAIDLDERERQWRQEGWRSEPPAASRDAPALGSAAGRARDRGRVRIHQRAADQQSAMSGGALSGSESGGVKLSPYLRGELPPEDQRQGSIAEAEKARGSGRTTRRGAKLSLYFLGEVLPEDQRRDSMADAKTAPAKLSPYLRGEPSTRKQMLDSEKAASPEAGLSTGRGAGLSPYLRGELPLAAELREGSMAAAKTAGGELSPYLRREFPDAEETWRDSTIDAEQTSGAGAEPGLSASSGVKLSPFLRGEHPIPRQTRHTSPSDAEIATTDRPSGFSTRLAENMEVLGADGQHVGVIDHIEGASIELKKDDPAAHGEHHVIPLDWVASVDTKAKLKLPAAEAWTRWTAA